MTAVAQALKAGPQMIRIEAEGRSLDVEYLWVGDAASTEPPIVFLHEGLGSVAMWKDFPTELCAASGRRGVVYSRPAYGHSTPRAPHERWGNDFLDRQARQVLPALLAGLGVEGRYVLFGHSDGGSIALIHAGAAPGRVAATIVMAPHILVEEFGLISIREARRQYLNGDLRGRLARYHADVDSAFWGWNDVWLSPDFPQWEITSSLKYISSPTLAIQGEEDPYGTMAQIDGIASAVADTTLLKLPNCGHSPHRDQAAAVIDAVRVWLHERD